MTDPIRAALERFIALADRDLLCPDNPAETDWGAVTNALAAARAAMAEPVGEGPWMESPTEEDVSQLYWIAVAAQAAGTLPSDEEIRLLTDGYGHDESEQRHCMAAARVALARWGNHFLAPGKWFLRRR